VPEYQAVSKYSPVTFMKHIKEISLEHMARYHAKKKRNTSGPPQRDVHWRLMKGGDLSLTVKKRKPPYILQREYDDILKELLAAGKDLTKRDLDRVIGRRKLPILEKELPCEKVLVKP
jgi:hypothetical protein